jgi:protein-S-isoprenylcysteine O-methyltransferase Ste14
MPRTDKRNEPGPALRAVGVLATLLVIWFIGSLGWVGVLLATSAEMPWWARGLGALWAALGAWLVYWRARVLVSDLRSW